MIENNENVKSDKWKDVVIVLLIIIVLFLIGLTTYVLLLKSDDVKDNNSGNTNITEKDKSNDNQVIEKEEDDKNLTENLEDVVASFMEKKYNNFADKGWIAYALYKATNRGTDLSDNNDSCDYSIDSKRVACYFGVTGDEYNRMDSTVQKELLNFDGGSIDFHLYDVDEIKEILINMYGTDGNIFDKSFSVEYIDCGSYSIMHDSNIGKIFAKMDGGCCIPNGERRVIIGSEKDGNLYKVTYVEYTIEDGIYYSDDGKKLGEIGEDIDIKNKLTKKVATFKKENGIYKFVD